MNTSTKTGGVVGDLPGRAAREAISTSPEQGAESC
jgi:hypothetical protein